MLTFLIKIHNTMNSTEFTVSRLPKGNLHAAVPAVIPVSAHLTPEGLKCRSCGQCSVGRTDAVEKMGTGFSSSGSSFIKRM